MKQTASLLSLLILFISSCSQYVPPIGGKKDTLAPELVRSTPANLSKNFRGRVIELYFNETIRVDNPVQKILITPEAGSPFVPRIRPNSLRLVFDKPLRDSTTYTFSFADAIRDASENNPASNLKLVFSTGPVLDSLRVGGKVIDLLTGEPVLNAVVGLYNPVDSLLPTKTKPFYFSRTDSSGNYSIENLRQGNYRLYAFDDRNQNLIYNAGVEKIAFLKQDISVEKNVDTVNVALFPYYATPPRVIRNEQRASTYTLIFDRGLQDYSVSFPNAKDSVPSLLRTPAELTFFNVASTLDTIKTQLSVRDSLDNRADIKQNIRFRQRARRETETPLEITTRPTRTEGVDRNATLLFRFNKPIKEINRDSLQLFSDSLKTELLADTALRFNAQRTELRLSRRVSARQSIRVKLGKGAFVSILGDSSKAVLLTYPIRQADNFGVVLGTVNTKAEKFIIELIDEKYLVVDRKLNQKNYRFDFVTPGKYRLRVIIDSNGNGKWDGGDLTNRRLPEPVYHYGTEIRVKQNFEIGGTDVNAM